MSQQRLIDEESQTHEHSPSFLFRRQNLRILIFELMGTGILATGICCTMYKNPITEKQENTVMMHDIYISLTLYLCICLFAPLTGGHFNPAVTVGAFVNSLRKTVGMDGKERRKIMGVDKLAMYLIGQFIGGGIGCGLAKVMYDIGGGPFQSDVEYSAYHVAVRCFGQFLGTFMFVFFILVVTNEQTTFIHEECWVHLFIPFCLYGGRKLSMYVRALNPAIVFVEQLITFFGEQNSKGQHVGYVGLLCVSELLGATCAALFFNYGFFRILQKWRNQE